MATMTVPGRYNGPPRSANGGYACGSLAAHVEGPVRVSLKAPPPLDRPLDVVFTDRGVDATDDGRVIARAVVEPDVVELRVPRVVSVEEAADAVDDYVGWSEHAFPSCYVCGPDRGDGLRLFTGPLGDGLVACPWVPDRSVDGGDGTVEDILVWAALDCPSFFGAATSGPAVLADLAISTGGPVLIGEPHVVLGWQVGVDGRRHHARSAVLDASGEVLAVGDAHWVEITEDVLKTFL